MSIRWKLSIVFLVISLVPLTIFSVIGIDRSRQMLKQEIGLNFELIAREKAAAVASVLNRRVDEAGSLSKNPRVIAAVVKANSSYKGKEDDFAVREIERIDRAWLQSKGATPVARKVLGSGISVFLRGYVDRDPLEYGEIFITDRLGATVAMTSTLTDYYQADEGWWREGFAGGKGAVYIDDRGFDLSANAVVTGVIVPIRVDGEVAGLLKVNFNMAHIPAIITNPFEKDDVRVFMHRSNGMAVIDPSGGLHETATEIEARIMAERMKTGWIEDEHDIEPTIIGYALVQPEKMIYSRFQAKKSKKGVSGEHWGETDWYVFVERSRTKAYAPLTKLMVVFIVGGAVMAVIIVLVSGVTATTLTNPLLQLRERTETIAAGNLDLKIASDRKDEFGDVLRDIDRMVGRLKETLASRDQLNREISARKKTEKALRRAQRMEAMGQLTGGIAHDFNNLLGVMIGNAEIVQGKIGEDEKLQHSIEAVINAAERGASLTQRLLAFSRQQTLLPKPTAINELVLDHWDMLQRTLGETIKITTHLSSETYEVLIDPHQFESALINLSINARDAMPNGGVLTIETANVTLDASYAKQYEDLVPGDYVKFTVSDTGFGMTSEVLEKVYEPFFTTKDVGKGSGLGLSMVYGFVKQSKGHITINSEVDHGTTVKLFLPRSKKAVAQEDATGETPEFALGSERILVVEDDDNLRDIPTAIFRDQGYEVVEAKDGKEAIKHLQDDQPLDLLFTDVVLPGGMNGLEVAEEAKRLQPNIKVLYTSGYAEDTVARHGKLETNATLINKPYRRSELLEKVQMLLDRTDD